MGTLTFTPSADGVLSSSSAAYATARAGGTLAEDTTSTYFNVGQSPPAPTYFYCLEGLLAFDTSSVAKVPTSATLTLTSKANASATDFVLNVGAFDFGTIATADWQDGAALAALTVAGSVNTSAWPADNAATVITLSTAAIVTGGTTRLILWSQRQEDGTEPSGDEYVGIHSVDHATAGYRPLLTVVTASGPHMII